MTIRTDKIEAKINEVMQNPRNYKNPEHIISWLETLLERVLLKDKQ